VVKNVFDETDTVLLGVTVDNIPTLHAWTKQMGTVWFHVLSDFWPHGAVAREYGVFRSDGLTERALFIIDKEGIIRFIQVSDINSKPDPAVCALELKKLE
jgi:peroxiredoxin (alkyl hydroperoxide reductase subunit C)